MALVDADKKAIFVDTGVHGRCNDSVSFRGTELFQKLESGECNIPEPVPLPGQNGPTAFVVVADAAFPMKDYMLRPPERTQRELQSKANRVYSYRHSRARHVVESFFGIMASRFRVLLTEINGLPENIAQIILACYALHNYVSHKGNQGATSQSTGVLEDLSGFGTRASENARTDRFRDYFVSECGTVSWQDKYLDK
ncbi:uncharacterized protein LOC135384482 [Ornithodoros turicata]|uniref:uncharacterized protein LOC135384482 n=1 Tax=Ornithodoros turicata TaxID=34597 RepID=UPI0031396D5C